MIVQKMNRIKYEEKFLNINLKRIKIYLRKD